MHRLVISAFLAAVVSLAAAQVLAGEAYDEEFWRNFPPLPAEQRAAFEKELAKIWHQDCRCYRFLFEGKAVKLHPPLLNSDRWLILDFIKRSKAIPLPPKGQGS